MARNTKKMTILTKFEHLYLLTSIRMTERERERERAREQRQIGKAIKNPSLDKKRRHR